MSTDEICAMRLPPLHDDCLLVLWRLSSMQEDALEVVRRWEFGRVQSEIVWRKQAKGSRVCKACLIPRDHFGMGRYVRNNHEVALIARRGRNIATPGGQRSVVRAAPPTFEFEARVGEHSEKPLQFYQLVREITREVGGPYVELFGRRRRYGWRVYGTERDKFPPVTRAQTPALKPRASKPRKKASTLRVLAGGLR